MVWVRRKLKIDKKYTPAQRKAIAHEVIKYIQDRSAAGKGAGNKKYSGKAGRYSAEYKKSLDFKNAGKSGKVNNELSGEMLNSIELLSHSSGEINYGFERGDSENNGKADGNIRGTYGQKSPVSGKARDFLTVEEKELERNVLKKFPLDKPSKLREALFRQAAARQAAEEIAGEVEVG